MNSTPDSQRSLILGLAVAIPIAILLWALRDIAVLVAFAVLLAYALDPLVTALERIPFPRGDRLPRTGASAIAVLTLLLLVIWLLTLAVPRLIGEIGGFVRGLPTNVEALLAEVRRYAGRQGLLGVVDPAIENLRASTTSMMQAAGGMLAQWVGRLFTGIVQVLGFAVLPLLTFYLLAESDDVRASVLNFFPAGAHPRLVSAQRAVDRALQSYVRGQAIVCLIMGTVTGGLLAVINYPVALLLGVIVAIAEVIPYLGFLIASVAIGIAGYGESPLRALAGILLYAAVNQAIGLLVTPRVMGKHLRMHPFVVTISILAGAELLGPAGAVLALPGAAMVQALIAEFAPARIVRRPARER